MSEEFRQMVADRTRSALEQRARDGRPTGGRAYAETAIVREIFTRFAAGDTMKAIASDLNRRGIPSPGAKWKQRAGVRGRWLVSAIHALLHNERYAGRVIWNRTRFVKDPDTGKRVARERARSEWIVREIEPIVDAATWDQVQTKFQTRRIGTGGRLRYVLSGLLECAECGSKLIVTGGRGHRYQCGTNHAGGPHACSNGITVPRAVAEERILAPVVERLLSPDAIRQAMKLMREARVREEHQPNPARQEVRELERLVRDGVLSSEVAAPAMVEARRRAAEASVQPLPWPSEAGWLAQVAEIREALAEPEAEHARACLWRILGVIRCRPAEGGLIAEIRTRGILLRTGTGGATGSPHGSGGVIPIYLPTRASVVPRAL